jgi:hypothetical protein
MNYEVEKNTKNTVTIYFGAVFQNIPVKTTRSNDNLSSTLRTRMLVLSSCQAHFPS